VLRQLQSDCKDPGSGSFADFRVHGRQEGTVHGAYTTFPARLIAGARCLKTAHHQKVVKTSELYLRPGSGSVSRASGSALSKLCGWSQPKCASASL